MAFSGMRQQRLQWVYGVLRDLYFVLLCLACGELLLGFDFLHELTRFAVFAVTIVIGIWKVMSFGAQAPGQGARNGMALRRETSKSTHGGSSEAIQWASSEMQGWRPAMEDAVCALLELPKPLDEFMMFGVFDGHGGSQVSRKVAKELPRLTAECATSIQAERLAEDGSGTFDPEEVLRLALPSMDALLRELGKKMQGPLPVSPAGAARLPGRAGNGALPNAFHLIGSTAIVVLLRQDRKQIIAANCGDSRAVLCRAGKAIELSEDHKPELPSERRRIEAAGGSVAQIGPCHRVDGWGLNLSRALGDFHYKSRSDLPAHEQKVIAVPEIRTLELTPEDEFLFLGCDGVYELLSSQGSIDHVRNSLQNGKTPEQAAEALVERCCSPNLMMTQGKGGDNVSCVVVVFKKPPGVPSSEPEQ